VERLFALAAQERADIVAARRLRPDPDALSFRLVPRFAFRRFLDEGI
jgi:hypothetical protein